MTRSFALAASLAGLILVVSISFRMLAIIQNGIESAATEGHPVSRILRTRDIFPNNPIDNVREFIRRKRYSDPESMELRARGVPLPPSFLAVSLHASNIRIDPLVPPRGYPWHRWAAGHVNTEKFIRILESLGSGNDPGTPWEELMWPTKPHDAERAMLTSSPYAIIIRKGKIMRRTDKKEPYIKGLTMLLEESLTLARHLLPHNPHLHHLTDGDFPLLLDSFDHPFCDDDMVPIFRTNMLASETECKYNFPFSSHRLLTFGGQTIVPEDWDDKFEEWDKRYPWETKIPKAVWRGSPTGLYKNPLELPRWKLVEKGTKYPRIMDFRFSQKTKHYDAKHTGNRLLQNHFMAFRAIVDLDGNGWSGRFGNLLCYNSIVIKVEDKYEAYFEKELIPWFHYLPVQADLSDLHHVVKWAVADENLQDVRQIVRNANEFCKERFLLHHMAEDFMWTLLAYAELLHSTKGWFEKWQANKLAYEMPALKMVENTKGR